ncbi:uncharacterized protein LOC118437575 [Folsomia candida]|uniref:uncharacterized protein LOC118437575 n=1 Tax=Folsomia candida TaxID=158441 RepID=UPI00160503FD|nr:uncharacterized protein LOC118437575 [Folsomia candida]
MLLPLLWLAACLNFAVGYVQEITFYTEPDQEGNAFRFRTKEPDLSPHYSVLLGEVKSFCYIGYWRGYDMRNYTAVWTLSPPITFVPRCLNYTLSTTLSLRHMGPLETTTPSVSIYSGPTSYGIERTFTALAGTNFGFIPTGLVLTGRSSWTGFVNDDFTGNSTCFSTAELIGYTSLTGIEIRSLIQGCNARYNSEYYDMDKFSGQNMSNE